MLLAIGFMCCSVSACAQEEQPAQQRKANDAMHIDEQIAWVYKDLAARLNVDASDISEETVRVVNWRSGAAGCPNPDMSYTMVITPGVLFLLRVDDDLHRYHSGANGKPFYCPADRAEAPAMGPGEEVM
jgi:hypothetical protein